MQIEKIDKLREKLMEIYVLFYLCIFPMAMHDKYFDIADFRFKLFWIPTAVYGVIFLLLMLIQIIVLRKKVHLSEISKTDVFFLLLILEMGLSTLLAPYQYEAFWGNRGRSMGFFVWIFFYIAYVLISRFYQYKEWHLKVVMLFMLFPCILGMMGYFYLDPFHFFDGVDEKYTYFFASTFGNINTYSAYTAMSVALCTSIFVLHENKSMRVLAFIMMIITMEAHIMSVSDNTVLSTAALFAALPIVSFFNINNIIKYLISLIVFVICIKATAIIQITGIFTMNGNGNSMLISLGGRGITMMALMVLLIIAITLIRLNKKGMVLKEALLKRIRLVWIILMLFIFISVISAFLYINTHIASMPIDKLPSILIFNDDWGTGRGINWRLCMDYFFNHTNLERKLLGNGPDTYFIIMMDHYRKEIELSGYGYLDNAHNEYLEYLVTIGIVGLILYLLMLVSSLKKGLQSKNAEKFALTIACFAYAAQAVVNIAVPIMLPIYIVYISLINSKRQ